MPAGTSRSSQMRRGCFRSSARMPIRFLLCLSLVPLLLPLMCSHPLYPPNCPPPPPLPFSLPSSSSHSFLTCKSSIGLHQTATEHAMQTGVGVVGSRIDYFDSSISPPRPPFSLSPTLTCFPHVQEFNRVDLNRTSIEDAMLSGVGIEAMARQPFQT